MTTGEFSLMPAEHVSDETGINPGLRTNTRLLDGREAVTFLVRIKQYIEDPRFML